MPKVLVVDDEGLIAHDISNRLKALGHEVVATVGTAEEAIARAGDADIVLMDIRLDGPKDGVEAATEIRDRYDVPVVFLTAHTDRSMVDRAKLAEPFGYIVKPLAPAALNTSIEIALHKHRTDRRLGQREAWLRTILGSAADAVIVTDVDGRVLLLNRAAEALTGWLQLEAEGQPVSNVVRLLDQDSDLAAGDAVALAMLRDAPVMFEGDRSLLSRSGREMLIEGAVAPLKGTGATLGAVLTLRDVSARRWEERQLCQGQRLDATSRLAALVANDYASLLAIVRDQSEKLLRQFDEYSPARGAAEEIQRAATEAEQLTRRLALFSTRQVSHQKVLSLNGILRGASKLIEALAGPNIEVAFRPQVASGKIRADALQIEQAITSLVLHARATMPRGGRLLIETANAEVPVHGGTSDYVLLAITHTGHEPGFEQLFEPVSTGDDGLALCMVHAIVTEHSGYVSAQPTAAGGCRFEVLLPRWHGPELAQQAGVAPSILLIDRRASVRSLLHNCFEANGYNLLEAGDAHEALALAEVHEGTLRLLIADAADADAIEADLRQMHSEIAVLRVVRGPAASLNEIRQPFTQQALLDRVPALLRSSPALESATAQAGLRIA